MKLIALFVPAIITISIRYRRNDGKGWNWFVYLKEYAYALLTNVFLTQAVISYGLGLGE